MAKIQINDVKLDGTELFDDSETFLDELEDGEMEQVVGGLTIADEQTTTAYSIYYPGPIYPGRPIHPGRPTHPVEPTHPGRPIHPVEPTHPGRPIKFPYPETPVIL